MSEQKEFIEVLHDTGVKGTTDVNSKWFNFEYNDYVIGVDIAGKGHYNKGMFVVIRHNKCDAGVQIRVKLDNGQLGLSIDHEGGMEETKYRSYQEWVQLESVESALKIIGAAIQ